MANVPTVAWDETKPPGNEAISSGDDRIRELKKQVREVVDADHKFESSGQDTDWGMHNIIHLINEAGAPGADADHGQLYQRDDAGAVKELFFKDPAGNDIQITNDGVLVPGTDSVNTDDIVDEAVTQADFVQANDQQSTSADAYGDLDSMTITMTTTGGVGVLIDFVAVFPYDATKLGAYFILDIAGNEATSEVWGSAQDEWDTQTVHISFLKTGLAAAAHTFKIQWKRLAAGYTGRVTQRMLRVVELKK